jgi:hypothetical protein
MFFLSFFLKVFFFDAVFAGALAIYNPRYVLVAFFFPATVPLRGPLRVRALV